MNRLKFAMLWVLNLIAVNPAKTVALVVAIVAIPFLNSIPDIREESKIDFRYEKDGKQIIVTKEIGNNQESYSATVFEKGDGKFIDKGNLVEYKYHDANILIWLLFAVATIMVIVGIFAKDDDVNFDTEQIFSKTISSFVRCELEEDIYYYFIGERFLGKSDRPMHKEYTNIANAFSVTSMAKLRTYPVWKTKSMKRTDKLEEIGV